eukprot:CAMPEP_0172328318 /NCGR_PEP_ID=MMETSP1058-20130122/60293_1 /TAXON_ID=83371 /ORGANISM="Detonula confervacea, Strain CCMP 353" /LENGTH=368 /DNA_ID=CAMNT_0013045431 /DNA_START=687 /DNA_END=1793 /DNA_ORIENTATION=+
MLSYYINLSLRIFFGAIAGALKMAPHVILSLIKGEHPPTYNPNAIELGAPLLRHVKSSGDGNVADNFRDVTITTKDGVKLHAVIDAGQRRKKGKRPIVFVHGFPEIWISWHEQMEYFNRAGHPILAMDMRGYGKSDKPSGIDKYHIYDHLVNDIRAVIEYATNDLSDENLKPLLVAHDWGANICWSFVCQKETTGKLAGYISLAIPPPKAFEENMTLKQAWASLYMIFFNMPWLPEKVFLAGNAWLIGSIANETKRNKLPVWQINTNRANALQEGAMEAQINYYRSAVQQTPKAAEGDYGTKENPLPLPTLIIRGMDDSALGDDIFKNLGKYLKNNKLVAFENCSHWIQVDCPNEVNSEIEGFLGGIA